MSTACFFKDPVFSKVNVKVLVATADFLWNKSTLLLRHSYSLVIKTKIYKYGKSSHFFKL